MRKRFLSMIWTRRFRTVSAHCETPQRRCTREPGRYFRHENIGTVVGFGAGMNAATIIYTIRGSVLEAEGFDAIVSLVAIPPTKLEAP